MSDFEEPIPGLTVERLYRGRITIVTADSADGEAIETGFDIVMNEIENWPDTTVPYLLLLDMSRVMLTPFVRRKALELSQIRPEVTGRTAIIISASTIGHLIRVFVSNSLEGSRERRVFFSREDGQAWLEELL